MQRALFSAGDATNFFKLKVERLKPMTRAGQQGYTGRNEGNGARGTLQQRVSNEFLQPSNLLRERGLCDMQDSIRATEVRLICHGYEGAKMPEFDLLTDAHRSSITSNIQLDATTLDWLSCQTGEYIMSADQNALEFHPMQTEADANAFRVLNEEWIRHHFALEEKDSRTLNDPRAQIIDKGGNVFVADLAGVCVGCVALLAYDEGEFELSKMAVAPQHRGQGIGRRLIEYTLQQARLQGARRVFLGSNSVLANAVHLYETLGFRHVPPEQLPHMGYKRADVYMTFDLQPKPLGA